MRFALVRSARRQALIAGMIGLGVLGASALEPRSEAAESAPVRTPESTIQTWPELSRAAARALIAKYGEPRTFDEDSLVWGQNAPWTKIIVSRAAPRDWLGRRGSDVVAQTIWYFAPEARTADLARFDGRLSYDRGTGELTSRAESEELNCLALNLGDEVVAGIRTPREARQFFRETARLSESGKSSPYMSGVHIPLRVPPYGL